MQIFCYLLPGPRNHWALRIDPDRRGDGSQNSMDRMENILQAQKDVH